MIANDSVSMPVLAVLEQFGLDDPRDRTMIYKLADGKAAWHWNRQQEPHNVVCEVDLLRFQFRVGAVRYEQIVDTLAGNMDRAFEFCRIRAQA